MANDFRIGPGVPFKNDPAWTQQTPNWDYQQWVGPKLSVVAEAGDLINGDRAKSYGPPEEDYGRTVAMFNEWRGTDAGPLTTEDGVMFMVFVKLSRERFKHERDNIVDSIGYLGCLAKVVGDDV